MPCRPGRNPDSHSTIAYFFGPRRGSQLGLPKLCRDRAVLSYCPVAHSWQQLLLLPSEGSKNESIFRASSLYAQQTVHRVSYSRSTLVFLIVLLLLLFWPQLKLSDCCCQRRRCVSKPNSNDKRTSSTPWSFPTLHHNNTTAALLLCYPSRTMFGAELMRDLLMPAFSRDITNLRLFGSYKLVIVTHIVCVLPTSRTHFSDEVIHNSRC